MSQQVESYKENNVSAGVAFSLLGGTYGVIAKAASWNGGNAVLQGYAPDGTLVTVLVAFSADGYKTVQLPPGKYILTVTTTTGIYWSISTIPA